MEPLKKIDTCTSCGTPYRLPTDKHIMATCPNCGQKFEYRYGLKVEKEKKRRWIPFLLILSAVGLLGFWALSRNSKKGHQPDDAIVTTTDTSTTAPVIYPLDTFTTPVYSSYKNPTETLLDTLEDKITDELLDALKDILEEILDGIREEAETGSWEKANERFERATDIMKNGGKNGKTLLQLNEAKLAKLKTDILSKDPNPNLLPGSEPLLTDDQNEESHATEHVSNSTDYTLTLYYTGPTSTIITIPPRGTRTVSLLKGTYSIVAKVIAPSVQEYYGSQTYRGLEYEMDYYITTTRF